MRVTVESYWLDMVGGEAWLAENGLADALVTEVELIDEGMALVTRVVQPSQIVQTVGQVHNEGHVLKVRHRVPLRSLPPQEIVSP